jgi:hypothetical protein
MPSIPAWGAAAAMLGKRPRALEAVLRHKMHHYLLGTFGIVADLFPIALAYTWGRLEFLLNRLAAVHNGGKVRAPAPGPI